MDQDVQREFVALGPAPAIVGHLVLEEVDRRPKVHVLFLIVRHGTGR